MEPSLKTRLTEYDVNKLRSAAKEINDILYDIPEGNYDLSDKEVHLEPWDEGTAEDLEDVVDYDDQTAHPVFGHDLPWQRTETVNVDDGTQMQMRFGSPSKPFEGKVESWLNPDMNRSMVEPLEYYKVCYSENDIKMVIAVLKNEIEVIAGKIEAHETGHFYTTISTLKHRVEELEKELENLAENKVPEDWTPPYSTYGQEGC